MQVFWLRFVGIGLLLTGLAGCPKPPAEICNNNTDDDGDGLADCQDSDCSQVQECLTEICNNNTDDDGDNLTDCQDPQCLTDPACDVPPVANDDAFSADEDTPLTLTSDALTANDADANGNTLTVIAVQNAQNGSVSLNGANITFTPDPNFNGGASFTYTIDDGNGNTDTALVSITVNPVNDAPVATDDTFSALEDTPLNLPQSALLANDLDVDGDTLIITAVQNAQNGSVSLNGADVTFTPDPNFNGEASFEYTVEDGNGGSDTATVTINVDDLNAAPVANDDSVSTDEDTPLVIAAADLLANDFDSDGDTLTISAVDNAQNGSVALAGGNVIFTPAPNFNGTASFEYTAIDGVASDTATVTVTVNPVNDAPVANNQTLTTNEDTPLNITLTANDVDGDTLSFAVVSGPANGALSGTAPNLTYTPNANFNGSDSFTFTANDGTVDSNVATISITVAPRNDAPIAGNDSVSTDEDTPLVITAATLLANDNDPDGDTLTIVSVQNAQNGNAILSGTNITFTPNADFNGTASFEYTVSDGLASDTALVTVTVNPVNDAPVANNDAVSTDEDTPLVIAAATLLANDNDADEDNLTIVSVQNAQNGNAVLNGANITFTPNADFFGTASFTYTVEDGNGGSDTALVTVTVNSVNDAPVAGDDVVSTNEDTPLVIAATTLLANDFDADGDNLTIVSVQNAQNGNAVLNGANITFTPNAGFNGSASFEYTVEDGNGGSDTATVTVNVDNINAAPVANDDSVSTDEDTPLVIAAADLLENDVDPDEDTLFISAVDNAQNGSVSLVGNQITFTPNANFNGTASFEYTVSDGLASDTALVTVTVNPVNDAPVADDIAVTVNEDTPLNITLTANDVDDDTLSFAVVSGPANGALSGTAPNLTYTPNANFNGSDSFTFTANDGTVDSNVATVTITVNAINDAPVAVNDAFETDEDVALVISAADLLANDSDVENDSLSVVAVFSPQNGQVEQNGDTITFTPNADFNGEARFSYSLSDGNLINSADVIVTVTPVNDAPVANPDTVETDEDVALVIPAADLLANDTDVDNDILLVIDATDPTNGAVVFDDVADTITFTPDAGFSGDASFLYFITDGQAFASALVTVIVNPADGAVCGNGVLEAGEECDDNNTNDGDGCEADCTFTCASGTGADRVAFDSVSGHCYAGFDGVSLTFDDAQSFCADLGGYLVTVTSAEENTLARSVSLNEENPWLGANDRAEEGTFVWVTGEDFSFQNFITGEPDDDFALGGNGDCLFYVVESDLWGDANCDIDFFVTGLICEFEQNSCGDNVLQTAIGEECDDGNNENGDGCDENCLLEGGQQGTLFFSEYIEGSGNSKALEIFNPLNTAVDLTDAACSVRLYSNGAATPNATFNLNGVILPGDTLVLCNSGSDQAILDVCNTVANGVTSFNGNDAVELVCGGETLDVIGQIGFDPGSEWGTGLVSTADNTIRRKCGITSGDPDGSNDFNEDLVAEWDGFAQNTFDGLGAHDPVCSE